MNVYFISGIGADERLFKHIHLPPPFQKRHINWIDPWNGETIEHYAGRLTNQIDLQEPFGLVGLSLGGIMAIEIAKITQPLKTILISSVPTATHLPSYFKIAGRMHLGKIIPPQFFKFTASCKHRLLMKSKEDRDIVLDVIRKGSNKFIRWGMNEVLHWKNEFIPANLVHIHGTKDEVFPLKFCHPNYVIEGGHMIIMSKAEQVNKYLKEIFTV